ncbi:MAG TPA: DUF6152 family protein [Caulobacteraceae bacterium]|nr:DUF6152 family protein [Caulobacteraceae bacterium]
MKPLAPIAALSLVFGLAAASSSTAHHSGAMYDAAHPITVDAVVKSFEWINPHSVLEVVTPVSAAQPTGALTIEMSSPGALTRYGLTKRSFKPGDKIKLAYAPRKEGGPVGLFLNATTSTGLTLRQNFQAVEKPGIE